MIDGYERCEAVRVSLLIYSTTLPLARNLWPVNRLVRLLADLLAAKCWRSFQRSVSGTISVMNGRLVAVRCLAGSWSDICRSSRFWFCKRHGFWRSWCVRAWLQHGRPLRGLHHAPAAAAFLRLLRVWRLPRPRCHPALAPHHAPPRAADPEALSVPDVPGLEPGFTACLALLRIPLTFDFTGPEVLFARGWTLSLRLLVRPYSTRPRWVASSAPGSCPLASFPLVMSGSPVVVRAAMMIEGVGRADDVVFGLAELEGLPFVAETCVDAAAASCFAREAAVGAVRREGKSIGFVASLGFDFAGGDCFELVETVRSEPAARATEAAVGAVRELLLAFFGSSLVSDGLELAVFGDAVGADGLADDGVLGDLMELAAGFAAAFVDIDDGFPFVVGLVSAFLPLFAVFAGEPSCFAVGASTPSCAAATAPGVACALFPFLRSFAAGGNALPSV